MDFADNCAEEHRIQQPEKPVQKFEPSLFNLYPNPNDGNMTLNYQLKLKETGIMKLYSSMGILVGSYKLDPMNNKLIVNNLTLASGVYTYQVIIKNKLVYSNKVIIIK